MVSTIALNQDPDNGYKNIYGFNADANFDKVWVGGEWLKASHVDESQAWTAGVGLVTTTSKNKVLGV